MSTTTSRTPDTSQIPSTSSDPTSSDPAYALGPLVYALLAVLVVVFYSLAARATPAPAPATVRNHHAASGVTGGGSDMSKSSTKAPAFLAEFREITGLSDKAIHTSCLFPDLTSHPAPSASKRHRKDNQRLVTVSSAGGRPTNATKDATKILSKHRTLESALEAYYNNGSNTSSGGGAGGKAQEKKLGEIWERFKDASDPKLIKIDGTMALCEELDVDPSSDSVLFCLAADLGSKTTGEWEKQPFVAGWMTMPGNIDSIEGMKARLPALRQQLNTDPAYFKKVYMHTFDLIKTPGSRVLQLDTALDMWTLLIPPALAATPSALSHVSADDASPAKSKSGAAPGFSQERFEQWLEFQRGKGRAVSKDTWSLFVDFVRSIDEEFAEYDESAAWPSTIDEFVEHVRAGK